MASTVLTCMSKKLFFFGMGYTARALVPTLKKHGYTIAGSYRTAKARTALEDMNAAALPFARASASTTPLMESDYILVSIPPTNSEGDSASDSGEDLVLKHYEDHLRRSKPACIVYLSSTSVYGDHKGQWVDETAATNPTTVRGKRRLRAENCWQAFAQSSGIPVVCLRLAGIYGPFRNALSSIKNGTAKAIVKPNQVFSRIHVEDITRVIMACLAMKKDATTPYSRINVCDDFPAPPQEVLALAARLLTMPLPPPISWEKAGLSPMALSFYQESKKTRNHRMKEILQEPLSFPSYKQGIQKLYDTGAF